MLSPQEVLPESSQVLTDLLVAGTLGFATDPLVELIFNSTESPDKHTDFKATFLYHAANSIAVAARVFGALVIANVVTEAFQLELPVHLQGVAPVIAFTIWAGLTVSAVKRAIFENAVAGDRLGRVVLYDRLLDFVLAAVTATAILDELSIDFGMGLQSVLAGGGVGALVFSLASRELATNIVGGFVVQTWDAFNVGDDVKLGDGTEGTVTVIGLVETEICGYDNIAIKIPNSQLFSQRVSNISRIKRSQVKQLVRLKYSDIKKLRTILEDIKGMIRDSCPKLITDGSKPFRAVLTGYEPDHIQAEVNCHFEIPPGSAEFVENREQVLLAIARAMEKNNADFALPSIISYKTDD